MSTVDWPKNICTVIFFAGCDFNCPYCQNSQIIGFRDDRLKDIREVKAEIRKNLEFIDAVLFSGGEACLQRQPLMELAGFSKRLGVEVGLETNGTKPAVLKAMIGEKLLDFVGMDYKAPLSNLDLFEKVTRSKTFFKSTDEVIKSIRETMAILGSSQGTVTTEFRTTIVPRLIYRKEDILAIAGELSSLDISARWCLQQFRSDYGTVLDPMYRDIDNPRKAFLEQLKENCLRLYPNLRIDVKAV